MSDARPIALIPRLDIAVRAREPMRPRLNLRPYAIIERHRKESGASKSSYASLNSASITGRLSYTNDGDKTAAQQRRTSVGSGAGTPDRSGPGGGSWV